MYRTIQNQHAVPSKWEVLCRKRPALYRHKRSYAREKLGNHWKHGLLDIKCAYWGQREFFHENRKALALGIHGEKTHSYKERGQLSICIHCRSKMWAAWRGRSTRALPKVPGKIQRILVAEEPSTVQKSENIPGTWESRVSSSQKRKHLQGFEWQIQPEPF